MGGSLRRSPFLVAVLASSCVFDSSGFVQEAPTPSDGQVDAQTVDAHTDTRNYTDLPHQDLTNDGQVADSLTTLTDADALPPDTVQVDMPQDTAPPDSVAPDTVPWPDTAPWPDTVPPTCDAKYGQATQYVLCDETPTSCEFFVKTYGGTCNNVCSSFGGSCLGGYDNSGSCGRVGQSSCSRSLQGQICICSK